MTQLYKKLNDCYKQIYIFNYYNRDLWVKKKALEIPPRSRVLDVGAGIGKYRTFFNHCEYRTHDFGNEPGTLGKYTQLDYQSEITSIPVEEGAFDFVLCTEVLEHVPEPIKAVHELSRVLKPGGRLFLTAPLGSFLHQEPYHFYGGYTPHWYRTFLPQAGFEIESINCNKGFFSWYGQETWRFRQAIHPKHVFKKGIASIPLFFLWGMMVPLSRLFPLIGFWLDNLDLESTATIGYHVSAIKK